MKIQQEQQYNRMQSKKCPLRDKLSKVIGIHQEHEAEVTKTENQRLLPAAVIKFQD